MFHIRNAKKSDISQIVEIEKASYPKPWDETAFICELSRQYAGFNIFLAAEDEDTGKIAGYIVGNLIIDYIHVLNIAVAEEFRKRGLAGNFMQKAEQEALKRGLGALTLEVRENNEPAVMLYKKLGYEVKGRRPKYYEYKDDALLMWKKL
jgi:ribosomal-protein-alanine N-acetyltransferase